MFFENIITRESVAKKLCSLEIPDLILSEYDDPHRFYHNWNHIERMLREAQKRNWLDEDLFLAIIFHDIVYDPKKKDNEEMSVHAYRELTQGRTIGREKYKIVQAILDTKTHKPSNDVSRKLCELDLMILETTSKKELIEYENGIFKEYQFVDWHIYQKVRIEVLEKLKNDTNHNNLEFLQDFIAVRKPGIGVYAGSFNPFHKGHFNILQKAEKIFDKVIIARGINPDKNSGNPVDFPAIITNRQIEHYDGLLTDFIDKLGYEVTLIRGIRNEQDMNYELTQYRYMQDLKPDIKTVSIFCDREYAHISSSAIKKLSKYQKDHEYIFNNYLV